MSIATDAKVADLEQRLNTAEEKLAWLEKTVEEMLAKRKQKPSG